MTEFVIDIVNIEWDFERQSQQQELKESGCNFDKINAMTKYFYKSTELNGRSYIKIPVRSNPIFNIEIDDKYCFIWSISGFFYPCNTGHPKRVSSHRPYLMK